MKNILIIVILGLFISGTAKGGEILFMTIENQSLNSSICGEIQDKINLRFEQAREKNIIATIQDWVLWDIELHKNDTIEKYDIDFEVSGKIIKLNNIIRIKINVKDIKTTTRLSESYLKTQVILDEDDYEVGERGRLNKWLDLIIKEMEYLHNKNSLRPSVHIASMKYQNWNDLFGKQKLDELPKDLERELNKFLVGYTVILSQSVVGLQSNYIKTFAKEDSVVMYHLRVDTNYPSSIDTMRIDSVILPNEYGTLLIRWTTEIHNKLE